jgi:hypothetical protein
VSNLHERAAATSRSALIRVISPAPGLRLGLRPTCLPEELEATEMDPNVILVTVVFLVVIGWIYTVVRKLEQRLHTLEKQHLALVAELENRLYSE